MAKGGLTQVKGTNPFGTPDIGGTLPGTTGGVPVSGDGSGGLTGVAFPNPWVPTPSGKETANSSGLPATVTTVSVPDGQGPGTNVSDRGVAGTPMPKVTGL
jgi:hypothetical protein